MKEELELKRLTIRMSEDALKRKVETEMSNLEEEKSKIRRTEAEMKKIERERMAKK